MLIEVLSRPKGGGGAHRAPQAGLPLPTLEARLLWASSGLLWAEPE